MLDFWSDKSVVDMHRRIKGKNLSVVLPEGEEDRVITALGLTPDINKVLLGSKEVIDSKIAIEYGERAAEIQEWVKVIEPSEFSAREDLLKIFLEKRKGKLDEETARELMKKPNYFATLLLEADEVHALVGGAVYSTADILKPAFQIIKPAPNNKIVSSMFLLRKNDEKLVFADCAVNIEPTSEQLKEITLQTIETAKEMGLDPKVALLSYSTKGSGVGELVDRPRIAYEMLIEEHPELINSVDGEIQFDSAYVERVAKQKAPDSPVGGKANVFIFPNITAGNIAYKMTEYLGNYESVGPIIQGLNKPVNDLSRGTTAHTIAKVIFVSLRKY